MRWTLKTFRVSSSNYALSTTPHSPSQSGETITLIHKMCHFFIQVRNIYWCQYFGEKESGVQRITICCLGVNLYEFILMKFSLWYKRGFLRVQTEVWPAGVYNFPLIVNGWLLQVLKSSQELIFMFFYKSSLSSMDRYFPLLTVPFLFSVPGQVQYRERSRVPQLGGRGH